MMTLVVDVGGAVRCVYAEELDVAAIGTVRITRASHIEPDQTGRWWADIAPAGGPVLGPFARRSAALAAERHWLEENLLLAANALGEIPPASGYRPPISQSKHSGGSMCHKREGLET